MEFYLARAIALDVDNARVMSDAALVIIARAPEMGRGKSRLAADIGPAGALDVTRQLLARLAVTQAAWNGPVLLCSSGDDAGWAQTGLAHLPRQKQPDGDLGMKIAAALQWGLAHAPRAIAIGTDCPALRPQHVRELVASLAQAPVAFGPARDGGYWGIAVADPQVIPLVTGADLPWSTPHLLGETVRRLVASGVISARGPLLADCDTLTNLREAVLAGLLTWPRDALCGPDKAG